MNKMIKRVSSFLWYVKKVNHIEPVLAICGDAHAVQDFIRFASEKQKIKAITCSRYISAFFSIIKFLNASPESPSVTGRSMEQLRTLQRQLEGVHRKPIRTGHQANGRQKGRLSRDLGALPRA